MAKVILINPSPIHAKGINQATVTPPLGLAYLAAALERKNHKVKIIDANILDIMPEKIKDAFEFRPDLVGITANIVTYKGALEYAECLKPLFPDTPMVFGGPYCSSLAGSILEKIPVVDAVIMGEGEDTLAELADCLGLGSKDIFSNIKGVVYRRDGRVVHNESRPLISNLDDLPLPAYHLFPDLKIYKARSRARPVAYIITSRGCPARCTFCNRNIFGTSWRPHSAKRVVDEITHLVNRYHVKQIDILDDNFTFDFNRAHDILQRLIDAPFKVYLNLQNGVRIDRMNKELLLIMKKAGVFKIGFGIETASRDIQKRVKKNIDLEKARELIKIARSLGMVTCGFFMIGLPGDNAQTMSQTIDYIKELNPHFANISICTPFPGTELFEEIRKNGEFLEDIENGIDSGFFGNRVFFKLDKMDPDEISAYFRAAYKKFYIRPSKIIDTLLTIKSRTELKWLIKAAMDLR